MKPSKTSTMHPNNRLWVAAIAMVLACEMMASDVQPPRVREKTVAAARALAADRAVEPTLPATVRNPFLSAEQLATADGAGTDDLGLPLVDPAAVAAPEDAPLEQLALIAARIPATGVIRLGGRPLLLLGQTRLRVGDLVRAELDGREYELVLTEITLASFTVKLGELSHTRPIRLPSSP